MVTVQFNFKSILEAQEFLAGMTNTVSGPDQSPIKLSPIDAPTFVGIDFAGIPADADGFIQTTAEPKAEKKKRGPKLKEKAELVTQYGIEDCRSALGNLFDVKGREAAKAALAQFRAARITDLEADKFAAFVNLCNAASKPE